MPANIPSKSIMSCLNNNYTYHTRTSIIIIIIIITLKAHDSRGQLQKQAIFTSIPTEKEATKPQILSAGLGEKKSLFTVRNWTTPWSSSTLPGQYTTLRYPDSDIILYYAKYMTISITKGNFNTCRRRGSFKVYVVTVI